MQGILPLPVEANGNRIGIVLFRFLPMIRIVVVHFAGLFDRFARLTWGYDPSGGFFGDVPRLFRVCSRPRPLRLL